MRGPSQELHCELDENLWAQVPIDEAASLAAMTEFEVRSVTVYANMMESGVEPEPGDPHTTPEVALRRHEAAIFCADVIRAGGCPLYAYKPRRPGDPKTIMRKNNGGNGEQRLRIVN